MHLLKPDGSVQQLKLGDPIQDPDAFPQVNIPVGVWAAAELEDKFSYCFLSQIQAPGTGRISFWDVPNRLFQFSIYDSSHLLWLIFRFRSIEIGNGSSRQAVGKLSAIGAIDQTFRSSQSTHPRNGQFRFGLLIARTTSTAIESDGNGPPNYYTHTHSCHFSLLKLILQANKPIAFPFFSPFYFVQPTRIVSDDRRHYALKSNSWGNNLFNWTSCGDRSSFIDANEPE